MEPHLGMLLQEFVRRFGLVCREVIEHDVNLLRPFCALHQVSNEVAKLRTGVPQGCLARRVFGPSLRTAPRSPYNNVFSITQLSNTRQSISLLEKVLNAFAGVVTMGSPLRLNEVLSNTGTPVAWPKRSIRL